VLRERLAHHPTAETSRLAEIADYLVKKSVWIVGGDGWAYDIGFGGLDHVLASGRTSMCWCSTPRSTRTPADSSPRPRRAAPSAKFASGKAIAKKDLGLMAMSYGHVYVARVAIRRQGRADGASAFVEAEAYPGPSLIIAYSHCIAHGYDLVHGPRQQKLAVESGPHGRARRPGPLRQADERGRKRLQAALGAVRRARPVRDALGEMTWTFPFDTWASP
jgi:pyruvate-ferredoxin/flavodoxin oxidoreductase